MPIPLYTSDDKLNIIIEFGNQRFNIEAQDAIDLATRIMHSLQNRPYYKSPSDRNAAIIKAYEAGTKVRIIGDDFGLNPSVIYGILKKGGVSPRRADISERVKNKNKS